MLDASLSEEEARRLLARLLEQGIASCGVVCMGYVSTGREAGYRGRL